MGIPVRQRRQQTAAVSLPRSAAPAPAPITPGPSIEALDASAINRCRFWWGKRDKAAPRPQDLPEVPLTRAALPPGTPALAGRLVWKLGVCRRPFVFLSIRCPRCGELIVAPWRGDWPVNDQVVSYQIIGCRKGERTPYLLALDPERLAESAEVLLDAQAAYVVWKARRERLFAERKAARAARRATAELRPFYLPPVGLEPRETTQ
jgi:hypothetical protein